MKQLIETSMKEQLIKEFEETTSELLSTLSSFSNEKFNQVPFEGSWTAGQVAEHLFKSESNIPRVLKGNSKETKRDPFEKTGIIRSIFLDYTKKLQSPEFILPSNDKKDKDQFINAFEKIRKELRTLIETTDLSRTFTDFPFPQLGEFTGWEWICFAVCHSKRHIRQMKIIAEKLKAAETSVDNPA
jgi:uncharacterized damage-inducible protein DinB